ncbi:MAG: aldehyde ferredoxin oxidoreductase family protein [Clostridiaceae bacterium]|jgi:aldehyde:ferredoxin oxidoreductase|nr:aldehyde ferredoxin oxidoreductase family protein [Clostridiaceae bacterium]
MATAFGSYTGKILKINLAEKTCEEYPFSDKEREMFLGGKILAAKIIYDNIKHKIDAYDDENIIVVSTGPLNGTAAPSSSRFNISAISPLTGLLSSSNCGGNFGMSLKRAGYDALVITGKAAEKTLLKITEDKVDFLSADGLWGLKTGETQEKIGGKCGKIVIGPAGENLVRYACIVSEERAAGRGGLGAVMGSKNLKAVTAEGALLPKVKNRERLKTLNYKWAKLLQNHPLTGAQLPKLGTAGLLTTMQMKHILATKNFSAGQYDEFDKISGEHMSEKFLIKNKGCLTCPIKCARVVNIHGKNVKGPEVEIMGLMGANILNNDLEKIMLWNYEMDEYGMDTISTSGCFAFAMELNEKGLWDNGLEFGKIDRVSEVIKEIAFRSSEVGDVMAEGTKRMSERFGGKDFCISSKGMELSAYEPRAAVGQGLGYAVSNRGGCHLNAGYLVVLEGLGLSINPYTHSGKATLSMTFQDLMEAVSAGGSCLFTTYAFFPSFLLTKPNSLMTRIVNKILPYLGGALYLAGKLPWILPVNLPPIFPHPVVINAATGMKLNFGKMLRVGERGYNLERLVNQRMGVKASDDALPKRLTDTLQDPKNPKSRVPLETMKKRYYASRSWDKEGHPTKRLIKRLGIVYDMEGTE